MQLVCLVCLLLFLSHARAQDECDEILISDLGSTDTAGTDGAIAQRFGGGQVAVPDVLVMSSRTVCLVPATTRDKYRFASVITTYSCSGPAAGACPPGPYPRTDQFEFGCVGSVWQDSTFLVDDLNDPVNPSITTLRRDCSFCVSPDDAANIGIMNPVDTETHCAACDPDCLGGDAGLGLCTGLTSALCCNFYENNMCTDQCSGNLEPDPDANFECVEMCDPLTSPENGQVTLTSRTVGSMATYSCEVGYNLVGNMTRTCQLDTGGLEWSDAPTCQPVDCGNLTPPPFGQINLSGTTFGSTATYSCNGDRELTGDMTRTCQANGTWSGTSPGCVDTCPLLTNPTNGQIEYTTRTVGGVATYTCNANYTIAGSETRTCMVSMEDLTWSGTNSSCEIVDCGSLPSLDRGEVIQTSTTIGSVANYSCNDRHDLVGVDQRTCLANGAWSDSPPTCVCPLPCQNGGTGNNLCTECDCAAGYSGPECENCALENCFGCRDVPAVCDACDDGYVINTLRVCECTLENCMTCQGVPPLCVQCKDGYIINAVDNTMCDCSLENCLECAGSPPSCEQCRSGFTLLGGGCVLIVRPCNVQFCQTCEMDDQVFCEDCNTGYSIDPQGACIINDDGLDTAEIIGIIIGCIIGAVLLLTITACIVAGIYRHKHPLLVQKKRRKVPPQMFIYGFGMPHPIHRQATNVLYEEDGDLLELEEAGEELEGEGEDEEGEGEEEEGEEEEGEEESGSEEDSLSKTDEPLDHADDF